ncbi:helicase-associated domain-containing protein [Mycolicibacterium komossense]|uniref:Helicase-associated domain-containing protein n=1 Tax=Mycolicibacterium komossense TaxID=1779 RepID=A0ABT3CDQ4_9MYCO|nr:helicase-associated domain-containing protein [Mycolicibacterium komossense]MCV7227601.1 helicase-associated domain-containing protein [Mycolicibacterium komossense]
MTEHTSGVPLGAWLADLPDERLIRLLELRPDLAQPPPGSVAALAARAQARQSVRAATDELDFLRLAVLDALLVLHADTSEVPVTKVLELIGARAPEDATLAALDDLRERALAWGDVAVRVAAEASGGLPWYPGQVVLEDPTRTPAEIAAQVERLDEPQRDLLDRLLQGSPVGRTRDAAPGTPADRPVQRLLAAGLLRQVDEDTVILPRQVGQVLRGEDPGPGQLVAPKPAGATGKAGKSTKAADVDATAAGAVIDLLREFDVVIETLGVTPIPELRNGGMGVREVKRLTKLTGINEQRLGLVLEIASAAGLITSGVPDPQPDDGPGPYWAPTIAADRFAENSAADRWQLLASTWLELPARPSLIGHRGPDGKPYAALSDSLYSTAAPLDRQLLLTILADLPRGTGLDATEASRAMVWRRPRWSVRLQPEPVSHLLEEAHALGMVGRGAISNPARALLTEDADAAVNAMAKALPAPIDHFLVQADLTVVVPGPLERDLADELGHVAEIESAGAAMVYRVSEPSIRRALDSGRTASALHAFFTKHSRTPVPQGLTYLIDDVARRHGQLRVGMATSFVRCEDPALLTQAIAAPAAQRLDLRLLAPTVAVSQAPIADVLTALRSSGFAPAAEDSAGTIVDIRSRGARVPTPLHRRSYRPLPSTPNRDTLAAVVAVLRKVVAMPLNANGAGRVDPARAVTLLQQAALEQTSVVIGYIDAAGVATQRVVSPVNVRGGQLLAFDPASGRVRDFAIHRVTSVVRADDDAV